MQVLLCSFAKAKVIGCTTLEGSYFSEQFPMVASLCISHILSRKEGKQARLIDVILVSLLLTLNIILVCNDVLTFKLHDVKNIIFDCAEHTDTLNT